MSKTFVFRNIKVKGITTEGFKITWKTTQPIGYAAIRILDTSARRFIDPKQVDYIELVNGLYVKYNKGDQVAHYFNLDPNKEYKVFLIGRKEDGAYSLPSQISVRMPGYQEEDFKCPVCQHKRGNWIAKIINWIRRISQY